MPLEKNVTTDCEDTRSISSEQRLQVSETEGLTRKQELVDAKQDEGSGSDLNSTESQTLENKLQNHSSSDSGDLIMQSEKTEKTPGVEAVSDKSPLKCEEIPNDSEETTETSNEVDSCINSNESESHLAEVPGETADTEAENTDFNTAQSS